MKTLPSIEERVEEYKKKIGGWRNLDEMDLKQLLTQDRANTIEAVREMLEGMDSVPFFDDSVISLTTALEQLDLLEHPLELTDKEKEGLMKLGGLEGKTK